MVTEERLPDPPYVGEGWYCKLVDETMSCVEDVQRLVLVGNGSENFPAVRYLLLSVRDPAAARRALHDMTEGRLDDQLRVSRASDAVAGPRCRRPDDRRGFARLAVGFTAAGLLALGLPAPELVTFPVEFRDGPHARAPFLGDTDANDPRTWIPALGQQAAPALHAVVGVWERAGRPSHHDLGEILAGRGFTVLRELRGHLMAGNREPFGFRDGVGQPVVAGLEWCSDTLRRLQDGEHPARERIVAVGEFVLGLPGELGDVSRWRVPGLAACEEDRVGYHGSFAALRVMRQDVDAFRNWKDRPGTGGEHEAAKLIGRTRKGQPLSSGGGWSGEQGRARGRSENFDYSDDIDGDVCPVGAHARRAHPRGAQVVSRGMHQRRIIRRGIPYEDQPWGEGGALETGLIGVFVCANLAAQYEGVLGEWMQHGLQDPRITGTSDPLIGCRGVDVAGRQGGIPQFVYTRGVAYLFVPGIAALRRLAAGPGA
jgi:deferrochelatase/peroxidase EfeB